MINRVRQLRKERLMTLEALAERAGVTKSYLSKVERGQSMPSIAVSAALARALGASLDSLFTDTEELAEITVTRAAERPLLTPEKQAGSRYEGIALQAGPKGMTPFMVHPPHDAVGVPFRDHPGEEFLFVHRGRVELIFPSRTVELGPGDAVYFKATTPHKVRSLGDERAELLLTVCEDRPGPREPHPHMP